MNALEIPNSPKILWGGESSGALSTTSFSCWSLCAPGACGCLDCCCPCALETCPERSQQLQLPYSSFIHSKIFLKGPLMKAFATGKVKRVKKGQGRTFKELMFYRDRSISFFNKYSLISCMSQGLFQCWPYSTEPAKALPSWSLHFIEGWRNKQ